ncbi:MAG TPA: hypothetical protein VK254_04930, partial [Candidatus Bathyarchaeia archaeon]|nr:hypothetical protein [Candidatus Bathyarchaeia archaeon]
FMSDWPLIRPQAHCTTLCLFFVVVGTVKPFRVSPVELVDYLLGKTIYDSSIFPSFNALIFASSSSLSPDFSS